MRLRHVRRHGAMVAGVVFLVVIGGSLAADPVNDPAGIEVDVGAATSTSVPPLELHGDEVARFLNGVARRHAAQFLDGLAARNTARESDGAGTYDRSAVGYDPPAVEPGDDLEGILASIRACESGGDYTAVSPSGRYSGAFQFDDSTWAAVGGSGRAGDASPAEQDARAATLYEQRGRSPWPNC